MTLFIVAVLVVASVLGGLAWYLGSLTRLGLVTPALFSLGVFVTLLVEVWLMALLK